MKNHNSCSHPVKRQSRENCKHGKGTNNPEVNNSSHKSLSTYDGCHESRAEVQKPSAAYSMHFNYKVLSY